MLLGRVYCENKYTKNMAQVFIIPFARPLDYDDLSGLVIAWGEVRYGKLIRHYEELPWWRRIFKRNPTFVLKRCYDDLFSNPPVWSMKLKTIDGTFLVKGRCIRTLMYVEYMSVLDRFDQALLIKK